MTDRDATTVGAKKTGSVPEVFAAFLRLGLTSFGGPIAHLAYMHEEFVRRRQWLDEESHGHLLAICQFLPGPASSQLGFAIGLLRAGWAGALAAFVAFTLPSAVLMLAFAFAGTALEGAYGQALVHGLKLVAVVVVAHGLLGMIRALVPDLPRALIALGAVAVLLRVPGAWPQLLVIVAGGLLGLLLCRRATLKPVAPFPLPYGRGASIVFIALFLTGLLMSMAAGRAPNGLGKRHPC
ncbi:chromate transporter [Luteimonas sp. e5]